MNLWIGGTAISSHDFLGLEKLISAKNDLENVLHFLRFWYSKKTVWDVKTSGSTGIPKIIPVSRAQILASAKRSFQFFQPDAQTEGGMLCISTRFVGGFMVLVRADLTGMDVWLEPPRTEIFKNLKHFPKQKKWNLTVAPLQLGYLAGQPDLVEESRHWKNILVGGGPLSKSQMEGARKMQCPVYHSYGMTETVSHIALARVNGSEALPPGEFQILPGIEVRKDALDCLEIKADITNGNWLTTRDRVDIKENGRFRVLGRLDRVINSGGLKIDPDWLKAKIAERMTSQSDHFEIVAIPDEVLGEMVVLVFDNSVANLDSTNWLSIFSELSKELDNRLLPKKVVSLPGFPLLPGLKTDFPKLVMLASEQLAGKA